MTEIKKAVVLAPHPDDDVLGCGGTIRKLADAGWEITTVYLTNGDAGSLNYSKEELAALREKEARAASDVLGVKDVVYLRNPDGYLEYTTDNLIQLINLIRSKKPELVLFPHKDEANEDHRVTSKLGMEAVGRAAAPCFQECYGEPWEVKTVLAYEVWTPIQNFSYIEDITGVKDTKLEAMKKHESQLKNYPFDEGVEGLNRFRGTMSGKGKYCEFFQVIKVDKLF
ncbi:MAG: PIG-L family deacetylase [Candidatus Aenigmarchaeota archaeon]|nr:PIG-L family deacetylase [Candidatus Aenigmarchaeota archaeon]